MHRTQHPTAPAADTDDLVVVTLADILRGAARYLELRGWTQRNYYTNAADPFPPACAFGAIGLAAHGRLITIPTEYGPGIRDCRRAIDYLTRYLEDIGDIAYGDEWSPEPTNPFEWNDRDSQTAETVIATLRAAADNYDRDHATKDDNDADVIEDPLLDSGGYLACGCHGSQRDHTCGPRD